MLHYALFFTGFILQLRNEFWGTDGIDGLPSTTERSAKLRCLFKKFKTPGTEDFDFYITDAGSDVKTHSVCEAAYSHFLGFVNITNQWKSVRREVQSPNTVKLPKDDSDKGAKITHASVYITQFAKANCDLVATASAEEKPFYVLPYGSVSSFWTEYKTDCVGKGENFCLLSTFTRALGKVNSLDSIM